MKDAIQNLSNKIDESTVHNNSDMQQALSEFKQNVIRDISVHNTPAEVSPRRQESYAERDPTPDQVEDNEDWDRNMTEWQERVLAPRLHELSESLDNKLRRRS